MKQSSYFLGAVLVFLTIIAGCRSSRESQASPDTATWRQEPFTIDGSDKEWTKPLPGYSGSEKISYEIANDGQNLYILMSTKDPQEQQKIIQGGMTVWVNTKADKSQAEAVGIGYPLDSRNDHDQNLMEQAQPDKYQHHSATLQDKKDYALYGFGKGSDVGNFTYGDDNPQGIQMRMDYNNAGELIYEASVPLALLYPTHSTTASYASKTIAVGFQVDGLPPNANVPGGRGGGGPAIGVGGGLGFGSFGSGGGIGLSIGQGFGGGGGGGRNRQLFKDTEVWQVVQLTGKRAF